MQLDFFNDTQQVVLRNDVIDALVRDDAAKATVALQTLLKHHPEDVCIAPMQTLIDVLQYERSLKFDSPAMLAEQHDAMVQNICPAAYRALGEDNAKIWLRMRWRVLAQNAPSEHAAPFWILAHEWQAAEDAVESIPSWRKIPAPLQWMLQARLHRVGVTPAWGLLVELAWLAPQRLHEVLAQTPLQDLQTLVRKFSQVFEGQGNADDLAWLPAWLLIERPSLASELTLAQPGQHTAPEQAMRTMLHLLGYERQGQHNKVVQCRKTLRDLNPELYGLYIKTR